MKREIAMRDYILNEARSRSSSTSFSALRQLVRNWQSRKTFAKLHLLDDNQLNDIGLTREHLRRLTGLPLSVDPVWEADRLRLISSRQISSTGNT
jgi:uncharacterized protein YjiS (DUF1127 family)